MFYIILIIFGTWSDPKNGLSRSEYYQLSRDPQVAASEEELGEHGLKYICFKLQNVFVSNCKLYLSQIRILSTQQGSSSGREPSPHCEEELGEHWLFGKGSKLWFNPCLKVCMKLGRPPQCGKESFKVRLANLEATLVRNYRQWKFRRQSVLGDWLNSHCDWFQLKSNVRMGRQELVVQAIRILPPTRKPQSCHTRRQSNSVQSLKPCNAKFSNMLHWCARSVRPHQTWYVPVIRPHLRLEHPDVMR